MENYENTCPLEKKQVLSDYFMENRAKLLDVAAFLDRMERAGQTEGGDFREDSFKDAIKILLDEKPFKAKRVLELLSDPTEKPIDSAQGMKGALGAWPGYKGEAEK